MGVSSKKLVYDFKRKYNAVNSGKGRSIPIVDVIAYLNEAQELWFEHRVFVAQTNQKVRNDLRVFKKDGRRPSDRIKCQSYGEGACIIKYPNDLYHRLNQIVWVSKDCCPDHPKEIIPRIIQSDDLHEARHNPNRKSDFFFEQLLAIESSDGIVIYHDNEMKVEYAYLDYYRKPKEIHAPSLEECDADGKVYYDYCGRIITEDQDFEVDDTYSANDIVDIAVLKAHRDTGDLQGYQAQLNLILGGMNLHK